MPDWVIALLFFSVAVPVIVIDSDARELTSTVEAEAIVSLDCVARRIAAWDRR